MDKNVYRLGTNRLFYVATSDSELTVTVDITMPSLKTSGLLTMTSVNNGLYYLDMCFTELGSHVFTVFEDGVKKYRDILLVSNGDLILYPED